MIKYEGSRRICINKICVISTVGTLTSVPTCPAFMISDQGRSQIEDESQDVLIDVEVETDDMDHDSSQLVAQETSDGEDDGIHHHHRRTHHTGVHNCIGFLLFHSFHYLFST